MENGETILAYDENITPEQKALLRGHNLREYPTIQELSESKDSNSSSNLQTNGEENSSGNTVLNASLSVPFTAIIFGYFK